jgi:hypothetical protein
MKAHYRFALLLITGIIPTICSAQFEYYMEGVEALEMQKFTEADSLFTLSLCNFRNENVYVNRAIARININDTIGFCEDLETAANKYLDHEAQMLFANHCCSSVDTIFYDRKYVRTDRSNHRYYEVIARPLFDTLINGTIHDKNSERTLISLDWGCNQNLIGAPVLKTDVIAAYYILDSTTYYTRLPEAQRTKDKNNGRYTRFKEELHRILNKELYRYKQQNGIETILVYYSLWVNSQGQTVKMEYLGEFPEIVDEEIVAEIRENILGTLGSYPELVPGTFNKTAVNTIVLETVEF